MGILSSKHVVQEKILKRDPPSIGFQGGESLCLKTLGSGNIVMEFSFGIYYCSQWLDGDNNEIYHFLKKYGWTSGGGVTVFKQCSPPKKILTECHAFAVAYSTVFREDGNLPVEEFILKVKEKFKKKKTEYEEYLMNKYEERKEECEKYLVLDVKSLEKVLKQDFGFASPEIE